MYGLIRMLNNAGLGRPGTPTGSSTTSTSGLPAIGGSNHAAYYNFDGDIDDVHIYNSALSGPEIAMLATETSADNDGNGAPSLADWMADSNGAGYANYAAYALGGSPHWFEPAMVPSFMHTGNGFDYQYNRRRALDPTDYMLETTDNLTNAVWSTVSGGTVSPHPLQEDYDIVSVPISTMGKTNGFYRFKILY